jgi:exonuclease VII small subunit
MSTDIIPEPLDLDQYRENTKQLVESIDRTTGLMAELSDNVNRLEDSVATFNESETALRDARGQLAATDPTPATTGHAAD